MLEIFSEMVNNNFSVCKNTYNTLNSTVHLPNEFSFFINNYCV